MIIPHACKSGNWNSFLKTYISRQYTHLIFAFPQSNLANITEGAAMGKHIFNDTRPNDIGGIHTVLTHQINFEGTLIHVCCEFLTYSFSDFRETECFQHEDVFISRLIMVERGRVDIDMEGKHYIIRSGMIYFMPVNHPFTATYAKGTLTKGFHLNIYDELKVPFVSGLKGLVVMREPELFSVMSKAVGEKDNARLESYVMAAVLSAIKPLFPILKRRSIIPSFYKDIVVEMGKCPPAQLRLATFAKRFHMSTAALSKGFFRYYGITWKSYSETLLFFEARRLLLNSNLTVGEITSELGFSDPNYFFRFFKRHSGSTPFKYRKQLKG